MIALADQRSFYASAECIFRPDLRGRPVAVASNNDGCLVAINAEAKAVGVKKFQPVFKQKKLLSDVGCEVFSSNYELYGEASRRIMATLRELSPNGITQYSIDEAFICCDGLLSCDLKPFAQQLKHAVWREQRIPMGVSIAPTKTLAKLGQYATKELPQLDGVCVLERPDQWQWLSQRVAVEEVWGVGRRLKEKLQELGVFSVADLAAMTHQQALELHGVTLARTVAELNGKSCITIDEEPQPKQQIICSRSFGKKIRSLADLKEAVTAFADRGGQKLRGQDSTAQAITTFITTGHHAQNQYSNQVTRALHPSTHDSRFLAQAATKSVEAMYMAGYLYAKAGIMLHGVEPSQKSQGELFEAGACTSPALMQTMDSINARFGRGTAQLARTCGQGHFTMRREMKSPSYLTSWDDLPIISIK